jgi:hypothetical protein
MLRKSLFTALCAALASSAALAANSPAPAPHVREAADFIRPPAIVESLRAGKRASAGPIAAAAAPTAEEVGDADSFGKNVRFIGLLSGFVQLAADCTPPPGETIENCVSIAPAPAPTTFALSDLASITIPGKSSESLFCHWQTPIVSYAAANNTGGPATFQLRVTPVYTIENEVLSEVIDPTTGVAYPGSIQLALTAFNRQHTLQPDAFEFDATTGTRACIAGLVSRANLIGTYGFTPAQAKKFFKKPTTIRLGIQGSARLVEDAVINIGTRFTGDFGE